MKKILLSLLLITITSAIAQSKNLRAMFSYKTFYAPLQGPYTETYLSIYGNSVNYKKLPSGKYQASVQVTTLFKINSEVKHADKYNLMSPEITDTLNSDFNFLDQQRISLPNGNYVLELSVADNNSAVQGYSIKENIKVEFYPNIIGISEIELVDSYTKAEQVNTLSKNGHNIVPMVDNFYGPSKSILSFYTEIYNTDKILTAEPFLVKYYLQESETRRIMSEYSAFSKQTPAEVIPLMGTFDISKLPSGNYSLVIDVKNKTNDLLSTRDVFIQRSSAVKVEVPASADFRSINVTGTFADSFTSADSLREYITSLQPISNSLESEFINNQLKASDPELMRKFFYAFWQNRNNANPEAAWKSYKSEVDLVQTQYGSKVIKGYNTDRGRVYLQYGPPSAISQNHNEPSAYPYEIWHYYKIKNMSNRKFVFYNRDQVGKNFALLHSDMQGEIQDNQWELKLHQRSNEINDPDKTRSRDYFGNKAGEQFSNPH